MERTIALAFGGFLACFAEQTIGQSQSALDEDLRRSEFCAKAARDFRSQPEWKRTDPVAGSRSFTSHFNKKLGKCLVKVTSSNLVQGVVLELQHVYDALEGTVIGGQITRKESGGEQKTLSIAMVRNGKILKDKDETREAYRWFQTLMQE